MEITTSVTVQDYVYKFYQKAASVMGNTTAEALMSKALFLYAGLIAEDLQRSENATPIQ